MSRKKVTLLILMTIILVSCNPASRNLPERTIQKTNLSILNTYVFNSGSVFASNNIGKITPLKDKITQSGNSKYPKGSFSYEQELYEDENLKMVFKDLIYLDDKVVAYIEVENLLGEKISLYAPSIGINGVEIEKYIYRTIPEMHSSILIIPVEFFKLEEYNITEIFEVETNFKVYINDESEDYYIREITAKANGETKPITADDLGAYLLYENPKITIYGIGFKESDNEDLEFNLVYNLFIENTSGDFLYLDSQNISVNGYNMNGYMSEEITGFGRKIVGMYMGDTWESIAQDFDYQIESLEFDFTGTNVMTDYNEVYIENIRLEF